MIQNKYAAALFHIVAVLFAALVAAMQSGPLSWATTDQIAILVVGAFVVWGLPLVANPKWSGALKVGAAAATAAGTALAPFLASGTVTQVEWLIVSIAVLNTLGVGVGVSMRTLPVVVPAPK